MVKAFIGAGFDALKLRTLQICQEPCNDRCSWVCSMMSILYLIDMCGLIYTYGVGSSLLVSMNRVSSKTSGSGTGNSEGSTLLVYETSVSAYFPIITSGKGPKDSQMR